MLKHGFILQLSYSYKLQRRTTSFVSDFICADRVGIVNDKGRASVDVDIVINCQQAM